MNTPGVADVNWAWRVGPPGVFSSADAEAKKLSKLAQLISTLPQLGPRRPLRYPRCQREN